MTVHTGRHFLQIPGPTNVPDRVLRAMDMPTLDHRGPEFAKLGFEVLSAIQRVFRTKQPVIIYPSSGTGAWEAAIVNALCGAASPTSSSSTSTSFRATGVTARTLSRSRHDCRPTGRTRSRR